MIKEIAFVMYAVKDIPRARKFYEETLGLKTGDTFGDGWIEYDVAGVAFGITNVYAAPPSSSVAFEVDDLDAEVAKLKAADVPFQGDVMDFPGCRMSLIKDPDGNTLCIHQRKS